MYLLRAALALTAALAILTFPAFAADKGGPAARKAAAPVEDVSPMPVLKGLYIGVNGGYQIGATEVTYSDSPYGANLDGLSMRDWSAGIQGGFDYRFPNTPFVVGVFGEWNPMGDAEFDLSVSGPGGSASLINATISNEMKGGLRAGYVFPTGVMVYAGGFLSKAEFEWSLADGALKGSEDLKGKGLVAGFEIPLTANVSFGGQYGYTQFDTVKYDVGGGDLRIDPDMHSVTGRLNFRF